jgi:hypothetical protein
MKNTLLTLATTLASAVSAYAEPSQKQLDCARQINLGTLGDRDFIAHTGRSDADWYFNDHKVSLKICAGCWTITTPTSEWRKDAKTLANAHGLVAGEIEDSYVAMFVEELSQLKGYE